MTTTTEGSAASSPVRRRRGSTLHRDLADLVGKESPATLRAAIVHAWAADHGLSALELARVGEIGEILDMGEPSATSLVSRLRNSGRAELKHVERVFETVLDPDPRRKRGAVYTPEFLIDYLIRNGLRFVASNRSGAPHFCDPACGCGGFLHRAAGMFARKFRLSLEEAVDQYIRGLDSDPAAVSDARCLLSMFLLQHGSRHQVARHIVQQADSLLFAPADLQQLIGFTRGVDLLATNPPYVKLQNLDAAYRCRLVEQYPDYAKGNFSLGLLFMIAGHRLLSHGGALAFVAQNNFFTSLAGRSVRQYIQEHRSLRRIVDFHHYRVFSDASAYTCLLFLGAAPRDSFQFERLRGPIKPARLRAARFARIRHDALDAVKWRLAKEPHWENLRRIERTGTPLGQLAKISVGFATLKDSVFLLRGCPDSEQRIFCTEDGDEIEWDITRRAVKVADMSGESDVAANHRRIIFPYEQRNGRWTLIPEQVISQCFPAAYEYLRRHRHKLSSRDKGRRQYEAWYGWARTQGREAPGPKLLTKTFNRRPQFLLDHSDQLFCNGYAVALRDGSNWPADELDMRCLQRILNSQVMNYYARLTSFHIEGDYQCYQKNFIERFSLPELSSRERERLAHCGEGEFRAILPAYYGIVERELEEIVEQLES